MKTNPEAFAFPVSEEQSRHYDFAGLTKREYMATQIASSAMFQVHYESFCYKECAEAAVNLADALSEELNKEKQ